MRMEAWVPKRTIRRYVAKQVYYRPTSIDQNQLILACESMTDAFSAVDSEWRYTYINAAMEQLIGYRREDVLGKVCWDLFPSLIGTSFYDNCHKATQSGQVTVFEEKSLKSDRWLEYRLFPAGGGLAGYVRDVTDRKRNEEQIARISYRDTLTGCRTGPSFRTAWSRRSWQPGAPIPQSHFFFSISTASRKSTIHWVTR